MKEYLEALADAIRQLHRCAPTHRETVPVREFFQGKLVWGGDVEVYDISGHPKAKRCYGWGFANEKRDGKYDFVTVLEIPPVDSPNMAVRMAIAAQAKAQ